MQAILKKNHNSWRISHAKRVAFLIDGAEYFKAFRAAVENAKQSILIVGWDIDSRMRLIRDDNVHELPVELGPFLDAVVRRRPKLHAYILAWDFAAFYALERELFPRYKLQWRTHRRVRFHLDDTHPLGGSHHQKIVVVDDAVAFVGGLDLTSNRWDTPAHHASDPRRRDTTKEPYPPFHDVQMMVDGEAAKALGDLVRTRWRRATGEVIRPVRSVNDPWPTHIKPHMEDVAVAIARTAPKDGDKSGVREVEELYLDAIAAAKKTVYIQNQYLSSEVIARALSERLREDTGPEILLVLPYQTSGWLEQATMDVLRSRVLEKLRKTDRYGRLRVFYPHVPELGEACVNVHAKVLVVDDTLVRVGSANLNNRSMGLDTECDLAVEAGDDNLTRQAIAGFRHRLLAQHLGVSANRVARAETRAGSLLAAVESLRGGERTLRDLEAGQASAALANMLPGAAPIDPEQPLSAEQLVAYWMPGYAPGEGVALSPRFKAYAKQSALLTLAMGLHWFPLDRWLVAQLGGINQWLEEMTRKP